MNAPWNSGRNPSRIFLQLSLALETGCKEATCEWKMKDPVHEGVLQCTGALDNVLDRAEEHFCMENQCIFRFVLYLEGTCRNCSCMKKQGKLHYMFFSKSVSFWFFCVDVKCLRKHRSYPSKPSITVYRKLGLWRTFNYEVRNNYC